LNRFLAVLLGGRLLPPAEMAQSAPSPRSAPDGRGASPTTNENRQPQEAENAQLNTVQTALCESR
jgi:hypothetical protein